MLVVECLTNQISTQLVQDRFPVRENMHLLSDSDIVNLLLKTNGGRNRGPNLVIFVFCSTLIIGGCVLVAWSRKYCLGTAKIASFVFPVLFKDGNAG